MKRDKIAVYAIHVGQRVFVKVTEEGYLSLWDIKKETQFLDKTAILVELYFNLPSTYIREMKRSFASLKF